MAGIGTLREGALHAALKAWYALPGDELEAPRGGYAIDIARGPLLVEIQTAGFGALRPKLRALLDRHCVRVVHPVARDRELLSIDEGGEVVAHRRSPQHGTALALFHELVAFPELVRHPNLSLEVVLVHEALVRRPAPASRRRRRRPHAVVERRLLEVLERRVFRGPADLAALLPDGLPDPFTTAELAAALRERRLLAQRACYCLRRMGALEVAGRDRAGVRYRLAQATGRRPAAARSTAALVAGPAHRARAERRCARRRRRASRGAVLAVRMRRAEPRAAPSCRRRPLASGRTGAGRA